MDKQTGIKVFHALLSKLNISGQKEAILAGYGVSSTKDLSEIELSTICARLRDMESGKDYPTVQQRKWRSNVLTLLTRIGVYSNNKDWSRVNEYLLNDKIAGKFLYEMNVDELKALHKKLQSILAKKVEKDKQISHLANCN